MWWAFLEGPVLDGPVVIGTENSVWKRGTTKGNRYIVSLNKKKNCPLTVTHHYVQNGRNVSVPMPVETNRTGLFKKLSFPARPPTQLRPGPVDFYGVIRYKCNPLFEQVYVTNTLRITLK